MCAWVPCMRLANCVYTDKLQDLPLQMKDLATPVRWGFVDLAPSIGHPFSCRAHRENRAHGVIRSFRVLEQKSGHTTCVTQARPHPIITSSSANSEKLGILKNVQVRHSTVFVIQSAPHVILSALQSRR